MKKKIFMKKSAILFFSIAIISLLSASAFAQEKANTKIASVTEKDNLVEFTLTSSKKFIYGNNRYVLHIGDKAFIRNRQSYDYDKKIGTLTFLIGKEDFDTLQDGKGVYLTYGYADETEQALDELSTHDFPTCWPLGKFSKQLLSK